MIRIRYRNSNELSPGLHAEAEQHGRRTTVYLLSGLTAAQRRSALRRLRLTARMGHCPQLPAGQLAFALLIDQLRTGIGRTGAVLRLHPAGSTVPIMVLSGGAIAFLLFSTVSIHVLRPQPADQAGPGLPTSSASAISIAGGPQGPSPGPGDRGRQGNPGNPGGPADRDGRSRGSGNRQLTQPARGAADTTPAVAVGAGPDVGTGMGGIVPVRSQSRSGASDNGGTGGGTTLTGGTDPSPVTSQPGTTVPSAPASVPATTDPAGTSSSSGGSSGSGSSGGVCVNVGPLGVCLNV
jgi:hypothetical protein